MENWDDLRVFLAVARSESLTGAGATLRIDPATVGRRIARLEQTLGATLFVRSPQGYRLTDEGQRMLEAARDAEGPLVRALRPDRSGDATLTGQVRIGAPDGCANYVLPQVCAELHRAHPELELQILAAPRVVNLSRREADLAITVSPPDAGRLTVQKITDYHLHLAQHRDLPVPASLASIRAGRVVGYIPDMIFDRELDYLGDLAGDGVQLASNSVAVQVQLLRAGGGVGIVHDFALPAAPELVRIATDVLSLKRSFYLVRHADDRASQRLNLVADALSRGLRQEVARLEKEVSLTERATMDDAGGT